MPEFLGIKLVLKNTKEKMKVFNSQKENLSKKQNGSNSWANQLLFYLKTVKKCSPLITRLGLLCIPAAL